jgi:ribosome-associated protein
MNQAQTSDRPAAAQASNVAGTMTADAQRAEADTLHALIMHQLDEDQAQDVISIPLEGKSSIADHMVIASGRSTRQVASMAQKIGERIKRELKINARIEGLPAADWVLIDAGDVVIHLFRPEVRTFYNLERMWGFGDTPVAAAAGRA